MSRGLGDVYKRQAQFNNDLLKKAGVLANAGTSFGKQGKRYVRFALVRDDEEVREAAKRIKESGILNVNS